MQHSTIESKIAFWLLACTAVVYAIVVVGGITRLTQSGLSMVQWEPLMGIIPPLTDSAWQLVFEQYKAFPEYQKLNSGMSLADFKSIYWWEFTHRILARLIGVVYLLPLLWFWLKDRIKPAWRIPLLLPLVLGGMQGLLGWYMVKSGLVDVPNVSHYRLTAHLGLAVVIFALLFTYGLRFSRGNLKNEEASHAFQRLCLVLVGLLFIMIISGGMVAGSKAGHIYNTFPQMHGEWLPAEALAMNPLWLNILENPILIQFTHRLLALLVVVASVVLLILSRSQRYSTFTYLYLAALILQLGLGISTLALAVPISLAVLHQANALLLLASAIYITHRAYYADPRATKSYD